MTRVARIALIGATILLAGAGCAPRSPAAQEEPLAPSGAAIDAEVREMDALLAASDAEDFSDASLADMDPEDAADTAEADDTAGLDDLFKGLDPSDFDGSGLSDDAMGY